ncbi:hypothetical protein LZ30DRAFT_700004 [Colletotrichum cereale]|nr:hypothetical protein LZ30DRAFT_700004 [Colletotrichum cereale]
MDTGTVTHTSVTWEPPATEENRVCWLLVQGTEAAACVSVVLLPVGARRRQRRSLCESSSCAATSVLYPPPSERARPWSWPETTDGGTKHYEWNSLLMPICLNLGVWRPNIPQPVLFFADDGYLPGCVLQNTHGRRRRRRPDERLRMTLDRPSCTPPSTTVHERDQARQTDREARIRNLIASSEAPPLPMHPVRRRKPYRSMLSVPLRFVLSIFDTVGTLLRCAPSANRTFFDFGTMTLCYGWRTPFSISF